MTDGLDAEPGSSPEAKELEKIHHEWKNLHLNTQDNLLTFEKPDFQLPGRVAGVKAVSDLVGPVIISLDLINSNR